MNLAEKYIDDVLHDRIVVPQTIKQVINRHLTDLDTKDFPYYFDKEAGINKIESIPKRWYHSQGSAANTPFNVQGWQALLWYLLYGWKREDGYRRFFKVYLSVARKNGKTEMAAVTANEEMLTTPSYAPEIYSIATKRDQARKTFEQSCMMFEHLQRRSKWAKKHVTIYQSSIVIFNKRAQYKPLSSDYNKLDSLNPVFVTIDEFHAHKNYGIMNVMESSFGGRKEPIEFVTTTASDTIGGPCHQFEMVCIDVLKGIKDDPSLLPFIFQLDEADDWEDKGVWQKANPNLGVSKDTTYMDMRFTQAKTHGYDIMRNFRIKELNQWMLVGEINYITDEMWMRHATDFDEDELRGRMCWGGIDMGLSNDLSSYCLFFPSRGEGDKNYVLWRTFCNEEQAAYRSEHDFIDYLGWARLGWLTLTTKTNDYRLIADRILDDSRKFRIMTLGYDIYNINPVVDRIKNKSYIKVEACSQGIMNLSPATKQVRVMFTDDVVDPGKNPIARWANSNVVLLVDPNENMKIHKGRSKDKVDPMVALIIAKRMHMAFEEKNGRSYFQDIADGKATMDEMFG